MNKILLSADTINRVLGYLAVRPYNEVYQLIAAIQAEAAPPEVKEESKPSTE